jgi:hypothetical protein
MRRSPPVRAIKQKHRIADFRCAGLKLQLVELGGTLRAEFSRNGNLTGIHNLLDLEVNTNTAHLEGGAYCDLAGNGSALRVAAWRARSEAVKELVAGGELGEGD